jgi:hypothetical protein
LIHVDVRRDLTMFFVEVSNDGSGWRRIYSVEIIDNKTNSDSENEHEAKQRAEIIARAMMEAWKYAGIECRGTSCGQML